jgi:flavin reductase (DIM6/NTAB) family NADH-FMN oxidoreductase RutF
LEAEIDEFDHVGLEKEDATLNSVIVKVKGGAAKKTPVPMVKASPIKFECTHYSTLRLPGNPPMGAVDVIIGRVIGIHINESVLTNGRIDVKKTVPIARCGYAEYTAVRDVFEMVIPGNSRERYAGLEGSVKMNRAFEEERLGEDIDVDNGDAADGKGKQ